MGLWYWGQGRLGPYSIVWYDLLSHDRSESVSGYVAKDGEIISVNCSGVKVRPIGANSTYPPAMGTGPPSGFHIEIDMGTNGIMEIDADSSHLVVSVKGVYFRWTGTLKGGIKGQPSLTGTAMWEEFLLLPPAQGHGDKRVK